MRRQEPPAREKGSIARWDPHGQDSSAGLRKGGSSNGAGAPPRGG